MSAQIKQLEMSEILELMVDDFDVGVIAGLYTKVDKAKVLGITIIFTNGKGKKTTHPMSIECAQALIYELTDAMLNKDTRLEKVDIPTKAFKKTIKQKVN